MGARSAVGYMWFALDALFSNLTPWQAGAQQCCAPTMVHLRYALFDSAGVDLGARYVPAVAAACSQLTIQRMPNWSVSMPKRTDQKVCAMGIWMLPPWARAAKTRSASPASLTLTERLKPWGAVWRSGVSSEAISTELPTFMRA